MTVEVERGEALGIGDLVDPPRGARRVGRGGRAGPDRRGARRGPPPDPGRRASGSTWRRRPGRGPAWGTGSSTSAGSSDLVAEPERLGVCVDTCHIFAAGYSLATAAEYDETMDALDRAVGLGRVRVWHLNDSLKGAGQPGRPPRRDRPGPARPRAVPPHRQRPAVPGAPDDPGDAQGGRGRRGPRRRQPPACSGGSKTATPVTA